MANSLLDFVMSLVRDPDAAARYAADPAGAIAGAQLSGVTSSDVDGLIPMVTDSMSTGGAVADGAGNAGNVWASGAATAAFNAFDLIDARLPDPGMTVAAGVPGAESVIVDLIGPPAQAVAPELDSASETYYSHVDFADEPVETVAPDWADNGAWNGTQTENSHLGTDQPDFDLF